MIKFSLQLFLIRELSSWEWFWPHPSSFVPISCSNWNDLVHDLAFLVPVNLKNLHNAKCQDCKHNLYSLSVIKMVIHTTHCDNNVAIMAKSCIQCFSVCRCIPAMIAFTITLISPHLSSFWLMDYFCFPLRISFTWRLFSWLALSQSAHQNKTSPSLLKSHFFILQ